MSWTLFKDFYLDTLKSKSVLGTDANGKVIDGVAGANALYLKLDQTTSQTVTGLADGNLVLRDGGVITTRAENLKFTYFV